MKTFEIKKNTDGNTSNLLEVRNDSYGDNQPWILLGPGQGESESWPCTLDAFADRGLYIDLRMKSDIHGYNLLGVQPIDKYENNDYGTAIDLLLNKRKPKNVAVVLLSLGGYGFLNKTSLAEIKKVVAAASSLCVIVSGPPEDSNPKMELRRYRADHVQAIADADIPIWILTSSNDSKTGTNSGTDHLYSEILYKQLKDAGAKYVWITEFIDDEAKGHNGTATAVWGANGKAKSGWDIPITKTIAGGTLPKITFYEFILDNLKGGDILTPTGEIIKRGSSIPAPAPIPDPVVTNPTPKPPTKRKRIGQTITGKNLQIEVTYEDNVKEVYKIPDGDSFSEMWIPDLVPSKPTLKFAKAGKKTIEIK